MTGYAVLILQPRSSPATKNKAGHHINRPDHPIVVHHWGQMREAAHSGQHSFTQACKSIVIKLFVINLLLRSVIPTERNKRK